jgi:hypothetical protein
MIAIHDAMGMLNGQWKIYIISVTVQYELTRHGKRHRPSLITEQSRGKLPKGNYRKVLVAHIGIADFGFNTYKISKSALR